MRIVRLSVIAETSPERRRCIGVTCIDANILDNVYFKEIQGIYDTRLSRDGPSLDRNDEGYARLEEIRSRRY